MYSYVTSMDAGLSPIVWRSCLPLPGFRTRIEGTGDPFDRRKDEVGGGYHATSGGNLRSYQSLMAAGAGTPRCENRVHWLGDYILDFAN